jgi:hypothetical protein
MQKSREVTADFGSYPNGVLPYSTSSLASKVSQISNYYVAYGVDNLEDLLLKAWRVGHYNLGFQSSYNANNYEFGVGNEYFWSTENPRPVFNNCTHRRTSGVCKTFTMAGYRQKPVQTWSSIWMPARYYFTPTGTSQAPVTKHASQDWSNAQRSAWWEMQPRFEGDISLFNFLLELKDVKELLRLLRRLPMRKLRNLFRRKRRHYDPTRPMAELHLLNEFGLKPLIADIITITCQLEQQVQEAQSAFAEAGLGRNSRHWSETRVIDDSGLTYGGNYYYYRAIGQVELQTFTATMEYSYNYSARSEIAAFMRYWGLVPTWESVWNAMPFTFLVDYVSKVGKSIARMEKDPNVDLLMRQYCESLFTQRSSGIHLVPAECHEGVAVVDGVVRSDKLPLVSGYQSSLYTRRVAHPNRGAALPGFVRPSSRQALNSAALLRCFL